MTTPETPNQLGFEVSSNGIEAAIDIAVQDLLAVDEIRRNLSHAIPHVSESERQEHIAKEEARADRLTEHARLIEWVLDRAVPLSTGFSWGSEVGSRRKQANAETESKSS